MNAEWIIFRCAAVKVSLQTEITAGNNPDKHSFQKVDIKDASDSERMKGVWDHVKVIQSHYLCVQMDQISWKFSSHKTG